MKIRALPLVLGAFAAFLAAVGLAACGSSSDGSSTTQGSTKKPIVIGAAIDQSTFFKAIDGPPLAAGELEAEKINASGGVDGRMIEFLVENTQLKPERTQSAALELVENGADVLWVSCDVDFATPAIQVGISSGLLTVSPCIGTDQMGPKRFGPEGQLAFSFGNLTQDEGAAMAQLAIDKGWKTATVVTDQQLVFTQDVCAAFEAKYAELGGKIVHEEEFTQEDGTINDVVSAVNGVTADTIVACTYTGPDLPTFLSGVRGAGNETPILGPWSYDGSFWLPKDPKVSNNIWYTTYASVYGDDPDAEVRALLDQLGKGRQAPSTGGFIAGAAAVEAIAKKIEETGGSSDGTELAEALERTRNLPTVSGKISFSPEFHTAFGREYRVIEVVNGQPRYTGLVAAPSLAEIGD